MQLDMKTALQVLDHHQNGISVTPQEVATLLGNVATTFAGIDYVSPVALAAKFKSMNISKVTRANVQLFSTLNAATNVFTNAVKKTASNIADNNQAAVDNFTAQSNYYEHTSCYSVVEHKTKPGNFYLYCIFNNAHSMYILDGKELSVAEVAAYMTPSAAKKLLEPSDTVVNKTHGIEHSVIVRTIALPNIVSIRARKVELAK